MLIDPTYLRYIFDGLESKSIHQDNISALPEGLIGVYEESLSQDQDVQSRERFLSFFSAWALMKKEVSTSLVSSLLNWPEQDVINYLSDYTKWFNSPTSGTYILYHERLRVYLLEKISAQKLQFTNQKIISSCQIALNQRKGDEWEIFALEHLPAHLLILTMQHEQDGASFKQLVYDTSYWNRQLEISKGFDWSKKMLNQAMVWAAKQSTDELIECALNKIDLHYMEQNDAPRIVELVAQNDIDTALQRIESFGGHDKEGLQRKFTLYMLCLMELTLLDSKEQPFRKTAIEKLLNHLDENMPTDHSLLNWNDFFPSYLMFQMACKCEELEIDYIIIYTRTNYWEIDWINSKGPYTKLSLDVLYRLIENLSISSKKCLSLCKLANALNSQKKPDKAEESRLKAFEVANNINDKRAKSESYLNVAIEFLNESRINDAISIIQQIEIISIKMQGYNMIADAFAKKNNYTDALQYTRSISIKKLRCESLFKIVFALQKYSNNENLNSILLEALTLAREIENEIDRIESLLYPLSIFKQNLLGIDKEELISEVLLIARSIEDKQVKFKVFQNIAIILFKNKYYKQSEEIILESKYYFNEINNSFSNELLIENLYEIQIDTAVQIGKIENAIELIKNIKDYRSISSAYTRIANQLIKYNQFDEALKVVIQIPTYKGKLTIIKNIFSHLSIVNQLKKLKIYLEGSLKISKNGFSTIHRDYEIMHILIQLFKIDKLSNQLEIAQVIDRGYDYDHFSSMLVNQMINKRQFLNALLVSQNIKTQLLKTQAENDIYSQLKESLSLDNDENSFIKGFIKYDLSENKFGYNLLIQIAKLFEEERKLPIFEISITLLEELALNFEYEGENDVLLSSIITKLVKFWWDEKKLFEITNKIHDRRIQSNTFLDIAIELRRNGNIDKSKMLIVKSVQSALYISDGDLKNKTLSKIAKVISEQGDGEQAISILNLINENYIKVDTLFSIVRYVSNDENNNLIENLLFDALQYIKQINNKYNRVILLVKAYDSLLKLGIIEQANGIIEEAINLSDQIEDEWENSNSKQNIVKSLSLNGSIDDAFIICLNISDEIERQDAFHCLCLETCKQNNISKIIRLLESVDKIEIREILLEYFIDILLKVVTIEKVYEIILSINFAKISATTLKKVTIILCENDYTSKALSLLYSINDETIKNSTIHIVCINFAKVGNVKGVEQLLSDVVYPLKKSTIQHDVALELLKNSFITEAIQITNQIKFNRTKNIVLEQIVIELHKLHNWEFAEELALSINQVAIRQVCWKNIGSHNIKTKGLLDTIAGIQYYKSVEAQFYYLKGWVESISVDDITYELANKAIHALLNDSSSLEHFLQVYTQYELIFGNPSDEKIKRFNQTLNIQWVQDIINQFSKRER